MDNSVRRRILLGTTVAALATGPFVIRSLQRTSTVPSSDVVTYTVPRTMAPSGQVDLCKKEVKFVPVPLPNKPVSIREESINACLSPDKKYVIVSYSYGNWKSALCHASIDESSKIGDLKQVGSLEPQALITSIGCSSTTGLNQHCISVKIRKCRVEDIDDYPCDEGVFRTSVGVQENNVSSNNQYIPMLLSPPGTGVYKKSFTARSNTNQHCWMSGKDSMVYGGQFGLFKLDSMTEYSPKKPVPRIYNFMTNADKASDKPPHVDSYLCSTIQDRGGDLIRFIKAPFYDIFAENKKKQGQLVNQITEPVSVREGTLVSVNLNGTIVEEKPFPAVPIGEMALLTNTHWCFSDLFLGWFIVVAPLDRPKDFTVFRFPEDQVYSQINGIKVVYNFKIHGILSDGKHLLCSRKVRNFPNYPMMRKLDKPLCEFGIVELPVSIG